jgi:hypothetical protein
MVLSKHLNAAVLLAGVAAAQYEQYILSPRSRRLHPVSVHQVNGTVQDADSITGDSSGGAVFDGVAAVTYDFVCQT